MDKGRIIVTGTKEDAESFSLRLQEAGFDAVALATIRIKKKILDAASIAALKNIESYDYLLVTSPHTVGFFAEALRDLWIKKPLGIKVAAVGPATGRALSALGFSPTIIPKEFGATELIGAMHDIKGVRILFPRSNTASEDALETLRTRGAIVTPVILYTTTPIAAGKKVFESVSKNTACIIFMSPSGVGGFAKNLTRNILTRHVLETHALAIGPTTAAAAKKVGFRHITIAQPSTLEGIIKTLQGTFRASLR